MIFGKVSSRALSSQFLKPFLLLNMVRPFGDGEDTTDGDIDDDDDDVHIESWTGVSSLLYYISLDLGCKIKRIPKDIDSYDDGDK